MGAKYTTISASGYNSSPPPDDGSQVASNLISWATHKTKLTDPIKTEADAINTALVSAFDYSVRQITVSDSTVAGDHMRCVEIAPNVSTAVTVSLGDAATMTNVYRVFIKNSSPLNQTLGRVTGADTLDGAASNVTITPGEGRIVQTNNAATGYVTVSRSGPFSDGDAIVAGGTDGTKKVRIEADTNVPTGTTVVLTAPAADIALFGDPMTTRGDVIVRNSSNATARLGIGAAGTFLSSNGTDVSWAVPGLNKLNSGTVTNAATLDIVMTAYTAYPNKLLVLDLIPATDANTLQMQVSTNGGSSYDSTASDYTDVLHLLDDSGASIVQNRTAGGGAVDINLSFAANIGNGSAEGISCTVTMYNTTSTAKWPRFAIESTWISADPTPRVACGSGSGTRRAAQDTDAVRIKFNSGNISSGTWALYSFN